MYHVTNENFQELYPKIERSLRNASFVSIDAEFSGLTTSSEDYAIGSLFDSPADRYSKLRDDIEPFVILQFGLTTFTHVRDDNKYNAETFRFYLLPRAFPNGNRFFLFQVSAIEFLSLHKFDFNQLADDGISYLNESEESKLCKNLEKDALGCVSEFSSFDDRDEVEDAFTKVYKWLRDETRAENVLQMRISNFPLQYSMQIELRHTFKEIWTEPLGIKMFSVIRVTAEERAILEKKETAKNVNEELLAYYVGFSRVFKLMKDLKKPLVGHNLLLDLMFVHKQFYRPLPKRYENFKRSINQLFPVVYDTKFLSYHMKHVLHKKTWSSNGLGPLYSYFKDGPGRTLVLKSPKIGFELSNSPVSPEDEKFHDAGWDSYCTGYCFARMAHIYTVKKLNEHADMRVYTNTEIMSGVRQLANHVNLIRADLSHLRLDTSDPTSTRPCWLYAETTVDKFTTRRIAEDFSRFGAVNVKRCSAKCFLIASPNYETVREILKHYEKNSEVRVVPYDSWRHSSRRLHAFIWVGSFFVASVSVAAWLLRNNDSLFESP